MAEQPKQQANQNNLQQPNKNDLSPPKAPDAQQLNDRQREQQKQQEKPAVPQVLGQASQVDANAALTPEQKKEAASMGLDSAGYRLMKQKEQEGK